MSKPLVMNRLIGNDGKYLKIKKDLNDLFCPNSLTLFNLVADDEVKLLLIDIRLDMNPYRDNKIETYCTIKFNNNDSKILIVDDYLNDHIHGISPIILMMKHYRKTQDRKKLKDKMTRYAKLVELNFCEEVRFSD